VIQIGSKSTRFRLINRQLAPRNRGLLHIPARTFKRALHLPEIRTRASVRKGDKGWRGTKFKRRKLLFFLPPRRSNFGARRSLAVAVSCESRVSLVAAAAAAVSELSELIRKISAPQHAARMPHSPLSLPPSHNSRTESDPYGGFAYCKRFPPALFFSRGICCASPCKCSAYVYV